ncbi:XRE family transcriptional regulator [Salmonella enterica]|nr:XRE family transcriptional regulator [Salmonella enterica]
MHELKGRLKAAADHAGFTQGELARRSGVDQSVISKLFSGQQQDSKHLPRLAQTLGIRIEWLMFQNGPMTVDEIMPDSGKLDVTREIQLWDEVGPTGEIFQWPERLPKRYRAYHIEYETGIVHIPPHSTVIVDPQSRPAHRDLVLTIIGEYTCVHRFHATGFNHGMLGVDDEKIPLHEVHDPHWIVGVIDGALMRFAYQR